MRDVRWFFTPIFIYLSGLVFRGIKVFLQENLVMKNPMKECIEKLLKIAFDWLRTDENQEKSMPIHACSWGAPAEMHKGD